MAPVFVGLATALLTLALVIGQTVVAQREAREQAMREGESLLVLNDLMSAVLNGETGQRGYLLTGKRDYLTPYVNAKQRRDRAMARLRAISADAPERSRLHLERLGRLTDAKFEEIDRSVGLAQVGMRDQALALIQADFGKMQMDAIRREVAQIGLDSANRRRDAFIRAEALERRLLPLIGVLGIAILALIYAGFRAERSRSLAQAEAEQAGALREANERAELLARELNHRVKNLFSVTLAIVSLSGRKPAPTHEVVADIEARIRALSLAHSASQGGYGADVVELGPVIVKTMEPYADAEGRRVRLSGPAVELPARMVTPIGLIIHELATNAVKYGALSAHEGAVEIAWRCESPDGEPGVLALEWIETGGPAPLRAGDPGFGSRMTTLAARQLGGAVEREWPASGAIVRLSFPLP
jgi:two-component sensor histidine kinase